MSKMKTINNLVADLKEREYYEHINQFKDSRFYEKSFQKKFMDKVGTKYFINFDIYKFQNEPGVSAEAWCQFTRGDDCWNVHLIDDCNSVGKVELLFEEMFNQLNCDYYCK